MPGNPFLLSLQMTQLDRTGHLPWGGLLRGRLQCPEPARSLCYISHISFLQMSLPLYQLVEFPDPSALEVLVMSPSHLDPFICPVWMNLLQSGTFCSICPKSMQICVPVSLCAVLASSDCIRMLQAPIKGDMCRLTEGSPGGQHTWV